MSTNIINDMKMEHNFANRLISARKMAGISLQDLADRLGEEGLSISKQSLNKYEQGKMKPDSNTVIALSNTLNVSVDYFYNSPAVEVVLEDVDFRKFHTKVTKTEQDTITAKVIDVFERYYGLERILNLIPEKEYFEYEIEIKDVKDAVAAAKKLREKWDLGYDPIPDVVEMLEDKGYKVIEVDATEKFDGMKANALDEKIIVVRELKRGSDVTRKRMTALHELAHHALNFAKDMPLKLIEKLSTIFASEVLFPGEIAKKELHKQRFHFYEKELILLKERWGISIQAIFYVANRIGIISDFILKKFNIGFRQRGYHIDEPGRFMSKELPTRMERLVYMGLAQEAISINEAAYFAGTTAWKIRSNMTLMV